MAVEVIYVDVGQQRLIDDFNAAILACHHVHDVNPLFVSRLCAHGRKDENGDASVYVNSYVKDKLAKACDVSVSMIAKYLRSCVDSGVLEHTDCRGEYKIKLPLLVGEEVGRAKKLRIEWDIKKCKFTNTRWLT